MVETAEERPEREGALTAPRNAQMGRVGRMEKQRRSLRNGFGASQGPGEDRLRRKIPVPPRATQQVKGPKSQCLDLAHGRSLTSLCGQQSEESEPPGSGLGRRAGRSG